LERRTAAKLRDELLECEGLRILYEAKIFIAA
jgi:hypothetical protein